MKKISKPLGWTPKEATPAVDEIVNKEEPARKKRKTKEVESEAIAETPAEEVTAEPIVELAVEQAPEEPTEPAA